MGLDATFYRHIQAIPDSDDSHAASYLERCGVYDPEAVVSITESVWYFRKFNGLERFMKLHRLHGRPLNELWLDVISDWCQRVVDKADEVDVEAFEEWSLEHNPLRPMSGFFFGGTDYTSVYFNNINKLASICRSMSNDLIDGGALYYTYESSW